MTDRCAACGAPLDPAVFHDDDHTGAQLCEACCPTCTPNPNPDPDTDGRNPT